MGKANKTQGEKKTNLQCKNCNHTFKGNFCPNCGQSIKDFEKPFQFLIVDLLGNMFAFDTRFWTTFKAILFKPGQLSSDFIKGKRMKYMPPFRFYVFMSFIFFFLANIYNKETNLVNIGSTPSKVVAADSNILSSTITFGEPSEIKPDTLNQALTAENTSRAELLEAKQYEKQFIQYFSWMIFVLMPMYAFFFWLFFRKSYSYYIGHLILTINQHAFAMVIFTLNLLLKFVLPEAYKETTYWLMTLIPIYVFIGTQKLYKKPWYRTLFRISIIWFIYFVLLILSVTVVASLIN